jgi:hypothetical protein
LRTKVALGRAFDGPAGVGTQISAGVSAGIFSAFSRGLATPATLL